jgi:predicted RNA-binding Zn ribbon-like protein
MTTVGRAALGMTGLPDWVGADETKPAPRPLLLIQAFVNTWEGDTGIDLLAGAETGIPWLRGTGLIGQDSLPATVTSAAGADAAGADAALGHARGVRESLRAMLAHNGGEPVPTEAELAPLAALARASRPRLSLDLAARLDLTGGPGSGLAGLLLIVRDAQRDGTWTRLKACRNPECRWAFFDRSHAHRGAWCDMATCGNMIKNRNFRARRQD